MRQNLTRQKREIETAEQMSERVNEFCGSSINREIKFKIWHPHLKKFIDDWYIHQEFKRDLIKIVGSDTKEKVLTCHIRHRTFLQFTGLKDKNGKEIYEGDIIRREPYKHPLIIRYCNEFGMYAGFCGECTGNEDEDIEKGNHIELQYLNNCEVIGNIYENPELLESEEK